MCPISLCAVTCLNRLKVVKLSSLLCVSGVPCGTLEVLDPRETPWANNPCSDVNGRTIQNPIAYDGDSDG